MDDRRLSVLDRLDFVIARSADALPTRVQERLAPPVHRDGLTLDPGIALLLRMRAMRGMPNLRELPPAGARAGSRREALAMTGPRTEVGPVRELEVPGPCGMLPARHYAPPHAASGAPLVVFFHGGGFVLCDVDTHDEACRLLCKYAGVHVLSVAYRLAPEEPFPAAVEDATAAFRWGAQNARSLGADPSRVAVAGDSAGGNLAAVVSLIARDRGAAPALQLLLYPSVDRTRVRPSLELFAEGFFLERADIDWFLDQYVGPTKEARAQPHVSPLLASDLSNLPPALVITAGFDPLRDEGEAYAEALRAAGGTVVVRRFESLVHGFGNMTGIHRASRDAMIEIAGALRTMLASIDARPATRIDVRPAARA
jgi:acetyl esterase